MAELPKTLTMDAEKQDFLTTKADQVMYAAFNVLWHEALENNLQVSDLTLLDIMMKVLSAQINVLVSRLDEVDENPDEGAVH